jgi:hypothetical protein
MKKFLICLLVVAIALLGFTGCPSPTTEDSGDGLPSSTVDPDVLSLDQLRVVNSILIPYGQTDLRYDNVDEIFGIVNAIENASYSFTTSVANPPIINRAAAGYNYDEYEFQDDGSYLDADDQKSENYPVYNRSYTNTWWKWTRALKDGLLADGDSVEYEREDENSQEFDKVTIKVVDHGVTKGGPLVSGLVDFSQAGRFINLATDYGDEYDIKIDGKNSSVINYSWTNDYYRVSKDHRSYYYTSDWSGEESVKRSYSFDTVYPDTNPDADNVSDDFDVTKYKASGAIPVQLTKRGIGFKIYYDYTPVATSGTTEWKFVQADDPPRTLAVPVPEPKLTEDMPFVINLDIWGRKGTNTGILKGAETSLLKVELRTWQNLVDLIRDPKFARLPAGIYDDHDGEFTLTGGGVAADVAFDNPVNTYVDNVLWLLREYKDTYLNGNPNSIIYYDWEDLPLAVKTAAVK